MRKTYAILGGNGALGVQLVRHLLRSRPDVNLLSVGRHPEKPSPFSLHRGIDDSRYEYQQIHIAKEPERLIDLFQARRPEIIVNLAAQSESSASWKNAWSFFETNNVALAKIVEPLTGSQWLKKWVQISSSEVYGSVNEPVTEETPIRPSTPYSASKAAADFYLLSLAHALQFPVTIIRPATVYGPGQQLHRIIPKAILCALLSQKLPLHGGGRTIKSFLHTDDFSRAVELAAEKSLPGTVYNVGPGEGTPVRRVVELIAQKTAISFDKLADLAPERAGHDTQSLIDHSRISRELGWKPSVGVDPGIDDVLAWVREHLDFLKTLPREFAFQV